MIHLIVGNTGSGKTTYAYSLKEKTKGIIFSIDKWNKILFLPDKKEEDGLEWFLERIERSEKLILNMLEQLEASDTDAILDLGLSKKAHREKFKNFAKSKGYEVTLHFLDISKEKRWERILKRNEEKGVEYEFDVSRADFDFMETWFETPTQEEMQNGVHIKF